MTDEELIDKLIAVIEKVHPSKRFMEGDLISVRHGDLVIYLRPSGMSAFLWVTKFTQERIWSSGLVGRAAAEKARVILRQTTQAVNYERAKTEANTRLWIAEQLKDE